jgi:predicted nuclease of predicted toxin-antitoxin system
MKIIVDVNLAVRWADMLCERGIEAVHSFTFPEK